MFQKHKSARKSSQLIEGYVVYPKAILLVETYCNKARQRGLLLNEEEYAKGAAALLAAGMSSAAEQGHRRVGIEHIKQGWERLRVLECPPDCCIRDSVILREDELRTGLPHFERVLAALSGEK